MIKSLDWNGKRIRAVLRSAKAQSVVLGVPGEIQSISSRPEMAAGTAGASGPDRRPIALPKDGDVEVTIVLK